MFFVGLLSGVLGRCFFKRCYNLFGELMDALALLNGAINFVLYCSMSRQFRTTFGQMMRNKCAPTPRVNSQTELQTTYVWRWVMIDPIFARFPKGSRTKRMFSSGKLNQVWIFNALDEGFCREVSHIFVAYVSFQEIWVLNYDNSTENVVIFYLLF